MSDDNVSTPAELVEALEKLGYDAELTEGDNNSVQTSVGNNGARFPVVFTLLDDKLNIACEVARLGDLDEERLPVMAMKALDANTDGNPLAWGLLTGSDDPSRNESKDWSLVATDSMPVGDLSKDELEHEMDAVLSRVMGAEDVLGDGSEGVG